MRPIGGYFELELNKWKKFHSGLTELNTGRNALEYILSANKYTKVFIPYFTCDVILEPFRKLNIEYVFYSINERLEIAEMINVNSGEAVLVNNYFGIKNNYISQLANEIDHLIVDNSQSFYSAPLPGVNTFYSCRKYFGVPDGAYVKLKDGINELEVTGVDYSGDRISHLIKRIEESAEAGYEAFRNNDKSLVGQPILKMSELTRALMSNIDYTSIRNKRTENFNHLHQKLGSANELNCISEVDGPMVYPFLVKGAGLKEKLIANKIFVATYWPNVKDWRAEGSVERKLHDDLIALPVDQRYSPDDMDRIIQLIQQ